MSGQITATSKAILEIKAAVDKYCSDMQEAVVNYNQKIQEQGSDWNDNDFNTLAATNPLLDKMNEIVRQCVEFGNKLQKKAETIEKISNV